MPLTLEPHPDYSERVHAARESVGLKPADVDRLAGLAKGLTQEIEWDPDELIMSVALGELAALCGVLATSSAELLAREGEALPAQALPAETLAQAVRARMATEDITADELGERAGWAVEPLLTDPAAGRAELNVDGLFDLCEYLGLPWLALLPAANEAVGA